MKADFHIHSVNSDGTKTINELFVLAKEKGLDYISITDHDVVKDVEIAMKYSKQYGIKYIPGIELSTLEQGKSVHILGFFRDESYKSEEMIEYFKMIKKSRENRTHKFIENLKTYFDIEISYQDVFDFSSGIIARPHIAKAINKRYPEHSFDFIFDNFIGDYSKAFVASSKLSVEEGINLLRRNNCLTILAHPTLLKDTIKKKVLAYDYDGIEAKYYRNKPGEEAVFKSYADSRNMIVSAGSDYHGIMNDSKHGMIGEVPLEDSELKLFLQRFNN